MTFLDRYYSESYPPSLWETEPTPVPATGATAGTPGTWTPAGSTAPASVVELQNADPAIIATPATAWTIGQYVATGSGNAYWDGAAWVAGIAPE